jgi:hypothetical protein
MVDNKITNPETLITTIKVSVATKTSLDLMKIHPRQSYDEVIRNKILEKGINGNTQ